jgi:hypothetical protein
MCRPPLEIGDENAEASNCCKYPWLQVGHGILRSLSVSFMVCDLRSRAGADNIPSCLASLVAAGWRGQRNILTGWVRRRGLN